MREVKLYTTSADYAYQQIKRKIMTKQLKPGQRLPEVTIASQMGVSRTPVREALRRLSADGLVVIVPNSGARLSSPTAKEMKDTFKIREILECLSVSLAALNIQEKHLKELDELILAESKAVDEKDMEVFLNSYESFHKVVAEASGNLILADYVKNILARTNAYVVFYDPFYEESENPTSDEHKAIAEVLSQRNGKKAESLMKAHIRRFMSCLKNPN